LVLPLAIAAALMYFAETNAQPEQITSLPAARSWSVETQSAVGNGDTVPVTPVGRVLSDVVAVSGIGLCAFAAGMPGAGLREVEVQNRAAKTPRISTGDGALCPHCGLSMPGAGND